MADDKLKIVATVEDQFTGPLGKLQKGLKQVGDETAKHGATWKKDWGAAREEISKVRGVLGGFEPILSKIGIGGFGAALSVAGIVTALKGFSGSTRDLNQMARQIGLTANELRTLSELGGKAGVSAETMKGAINQFAGNMVDLRQRWGQAYGELKNMNLGKLAEELVNAPNMEAAIERAMEGLRGVPDPQKRARVSMLLFGTPDIGIVASSLNGPIRDAVKKLQAELGTLDKSTLEAAERFEQNLNRMHNRWENLKLKTLGPLLEGADKVLEGAEQERKAAPSRERQDQIRRQIDVLDESIARKRMNGDEAGAAQSQKKRDALAAEMQRLTDEIRKLREQGGGASVSPSSFSGSISGGGSLIQKAAWGGFGSSGSSSAIPAYGSPDGSGGGTGGGTGGASGRSSGADLGDGIRGRPFGSRGTLGGSRGALGGEAPIGDRGMLDLIAHAEGTTRRGYNDSFAHQVGGDLTGKTLGEIEQIQRRMRGSSAIGRYQFMRGTLFGNGRGDHGLVGELGIGRDERFTPELQDRLGNALIERRYREAQRNQRRYGGDFMRHFRTSLAREWASFPGDYGQRGRNGGMYPGQSASIGRDRLTQGAQRWLDEREGRTARSGPRAPASSAADGIRQTQPWTRAPAIPPASGPGSAGNRADNVSLRTRDRNERASIDDLLMENEAQTRQQRQSETFQDFYRRRATTADGYTGHSWGQREDEVQRRPRDGSGDSMFGSARGMTDELNGTHRDNATRRGADGLTYEEYLDRGVQDRKPRESEFTPQRELSLDEIRKFRGPNRGVGDALMDRFYGKGAVGGGSAMQMPGGSGAGGKGSLHIKVDGPAGTQVKADMSDLFGETKVSHGKSQMNL